MPRAAEGEDGRGNGLGRSEDRFGGRRQQRSRRKIMEQGLIRAKFMVWFSELCRKRPRSRQRASPTPLGNVRVRGDAARPGAGAGKEVEIKVGGGQEQRGFDLDGGWERQHWR